MTMTKKSTQLFWHWVSYWRIIFWLNVSPLSLSNRYSSCGWAGRSTTLCFCFRNWSARKSKYIRFQRKIFDLHLRGFLLVVVVFLVVALVCDQFIQAMRNPDPRVRIVFFKDSILVPTPYYLVDSWLWFSIRAQFWCSLESNFSGQMVLHLLAKCTHDKPLTL